MGIIVWLIVWLILLVIVLLLLVVAGLIIYARWHYGSLEGLGFPVIKPHFCLGSNPNGHNEKSHLVDLERARNNGPIYGVYDGRAPAIFVSDPELLRIIQSRDFDHFRSHRSFIVTDQHPVTSELLDFLDDEKWKVVRAVLTPHFTTGKIKQMSDTISELTEDYVAALIQDNAERDVIQMDFRKYIPPLVLEIIGKCFCGINIDNPRDPDNQLVRVLKMSLGGDSMIRFDWSYTLVNALPVLAKLAPMFQNGALHDFDQTIREILKTREDSKIVTADMVNTLLEMFRKAQTDVNYKRLGISENTAIGQAYEFFVASYEAVRSTLTLLTYHLAANPEIQEKLMEEVDSVVKQNNGKVTSATVSDMPYATACLSETLRLTPGVVRLDRRCTKDWEYNGIKIKKDMTVIIPLWALHRDPVQFPEPELFDPERFMPGRKETIHPYAFNTFGQGPRACIGQRFAFEMLKIIVVHYWKEFRVERREDTVFREHKGNPFFLTYDPILVNFIRRK